MTPITIKEAQTELDNLLDKYEWFYCSEIEMDGTIRAYVEEMTKDIIELVPNKLYGYEIHLAFAGYARCQAKGFVHMEVETKSNIDIN
jgi:hypothetical protein